MPIRYGFRSTVGLFFPAYAVALLSMRVLMRDLFDRLPFIWFLILCSGCMLGSLAALTLMHGMPSMLLAAVLMAGAYGLMSSASQMSAVKIGGHGHEGRSNALYYMGLDLGMSLGPMLGGALCAYVDVRWLLLAMMVSVPAAIIVYLLGRRVEQL